MAVATADTVRGDFSNARFSGRSGPATFQRKDGRYFIVTSGPDGNPGTFEVKYTFGVEPLQQYLVELPGGRLQAFGIAWDTRPKAQGGQRWLDLNPSRTLRPGDPLHWTGFEQTWNYQCADCHSTNVRKNYDERTRTYRTTWSEIAVGCEACHGPASNHLAWARRDGRWQDFDAGKGLTNPLDERRAITWAQAPGGGLRRSTQRRTSREIDTCARCHAHRAQFSDDHVAGQPLAQAFRVTPLQTPLFHADGQQRDEVYGYASFLQSRMHAQGVTCSDCHDPHSQKLRAPGNGACAQCHAPARYDDPAHHRHAPSSAGARCAACHMPTTTYMVVDPRHDHSIRIPRPDRTLSMGVPNACNQCHANRSAQWAADAITRWIPKRGEGHQTFAEALHAGDRGAPGAQQALVQVVIDRQQPPIARASAAQRLANYGGSDTLAALSNALDDPDALVREAAVTALSGTEPALRSRLLARMLADPVRTVRMETARALAGEPEARLAGDEARTRFARALDEYLAGLRFNADRPEAHLALGALHAARGRAPEADAAMRKALEIDPSFVAASVNLAELQRATEGEDAAQRTLRAALERDPKSAAARHALGLSLVRQKRASEALTEFARAAQLAPDVPRFAFVHGVALYDSGRRPDAINVLKGALGRHPYDREILHALALYERTANPSAARTHAELLVTLEPDNLDFARLATELRAITRR